MIEYRKGCLVKGFRACEVGAIAHQANCQNTMNSGVAKAIRAAWPEVYEADCQTVKGAVDKLGTLSWCPVVLDKRRSFDKVESFEAYCAPVFNLYGQFYYGREPGKVYTDYDALRSAISQMKIFLDALSITSVGLPKLGCGLAGGDWKVVSKIIEQELCEKGIQVVVYEKE